jgi:hypothetical protein
MQSTRSRERVVTPTLRGEELDAPSPPFRSGAGGHVWLGDDGAFERDTRVRISPNTAHAMLGHGVVEELNRLPLMGELGNGLDTVIPQAELRAAAEILYEADRNTYGGTWEFEVGFDASGTLYRLRVDNREYQSGLLRLTDLLNAASRIGYAVWLRI